MELLEVYQLACRLHSGQVDKAGRPYIEHLTRVYLRVLAAGGDRFQLMAALLHDSIEDGKVSEAQLLWLGVPAAAVTLVVVLTKLKSQRYEVYLGLVKRNPAALLVKLEDVNDNKDPERLAELPAAEAGRLRTKYQRAWDFLASA